MKVFRAQIFYGAMLDNQGPLKTIRVGQNSMAKVGQFWVAINSWIRKSDYRKCQEVEFVEHNPRLGPISLSSDLGKFRGVHGLNRSSQFNPALSCLSTAFISGTGQTNRPSSLSQYPAKIVSRSDGKMPGSPCHVKFFTCNFC